jgi:hypothetical protein
MIAASLYKELYSGPNAHIASKSAISYLPHKRNPQKVKPSMEND